MVDGHLGYPALWPAYECVGYEAGGSARLADSPAEPAGGERRTRRREIMGRGFINMLRRETKEQVYYVSAER